MPTDSRDDSNWWHRSGLRWGALLVAAVLLGLLAQPPVQLMDPGGGRMLPRVPSPPPNLRALLYFLGVGSVVWYAAIVALPFLLWGARRLNADRDGRFRTIGAATVVIALLVGATGVAQYLVVYGGTGLGPPISMYLPVALRQALLPWIAVFGVVAAIEGRRRTLRSVVERERLRAQVAEQRLITLTSQLQPHFLFNTLQGISTLIHRDPVAADEMLAKLSDLLRDLLRHRDRVLVPLEDELRHARTYLEISQLRFGERLQVVIDVPAELHRAEVPLFVLQPLVENALTHGIGSRLTGGLVALTIRRQGDRLSLEVADDGVGLTDAGAAGEGVGLGNTRDRLRAAFGDDHSLTLSEGGQGGTRVCIEIPFRSCRVPAESA